MNLLAALTDNPQAVNQIYNTVVNSRTSLNKLFNMLRSRLSKHYGHLEKFVATYRDFRSGDVKHSQADISKGSQLLGYMPTHIIEQGLDEPLVWYKNELC